MNLSRPAYIDYLQMELKKAEDRIKQLELHITKEKLLPQGSEKRIIDRNKNSIVNLMPGRVNEVFNDHGVSRSSKDDQHKQSRKLESKNGRGKEMEKDRNGSYHFA